MIGKSLVNDFLYTKLKYKQYPYFSLNIPLMFFCVSFHSAFCLASPCFFFVYLNIYLMHYQDNNIEHHKVSAIHFKLPAFLEKKGNKQTYSSSLQLKGCAQYSLLVDITHYWLFKFLVEVKFLVGRQISSRSLVNVNCKYAKQWRSQKSAS